MSHSHDKEYDLERRTFIFAKKCRLFVKKIPTSIAHTEDARQSVRSSGSVHANFIEASEAISEKDFIHRVKICRKEAKESRSWIALIEAPRNATEKKDLLQEALELTKIFGAIIEKKKHISS